MYGEGGLREVDIVDITENVRKILLAYSKGTFYSTTSSHLQNFTFTLLLLNIVIYLLSTKLWKNKQDFVAFSQCNFVDIGVNTCSNY